MTVCDECGDESTTIAAGVRCRGGSLPCGGYYQTALCDRCREDDVETAATHTLMGCGAGVTLLCTPCAADVEANNDDPVHFTIEPLPA